LPFKFDASVVSHIYRGMGAMASEKMALRQRKSIRPSEENRSSKTEVE